LIFSDHRKTIGNRLADASAGLISFIGANIPAHVMKLHRFIDMSAMEARHILFQEDDKDTYVRTKGFPPQNLKRLRSSGKVDPFGGQIRPRQ